MEAMLKMDRYGRLLIPKQIRTSQGMGPGIEVHLRINPKNGVIELRPKEPGYSIAWVEIAEDGFPIISYPEGTIHDYDVVEAIREAREERADHIASLVDGK